MTELTAIKGGKTDGPPDEEGGHIKRLSNAAREAREALGEPEPAAYFLYTHILVKSMPGGIWTASVGLWRQEEDRRYQVAVSEAIGPDPTNAVYKANDRLLADLDRMGIDPATVERR